MKNKLIIYIICIVFSTGSIVLLFKAENTKTLLLGINTLLFFGCGGIAYYTMNTKRNRKIERSKTITLRQARGKLIVLSVACSVFVICSWLFMPFNHLFDDIHRYTPVLGYTVGIAGMLFFGFGVVFSILRLIRPKTVMQISDEGLIIPKGKKQELIFWKEISATTHDDNFLFINVSSTDQTIDRIVSIPVAMLGCGADDIEDLIKGIIADNASAYNQTGRIKAE